MNKHTTAQQKPLFSQSDLSPGLLHGLTDEEADGARMDLSDAILARLGKDIMDPATTADTRIEAVAILMDVITSVRTYCPQLDAGAVCDEVRRKYNLGLAAHAIWQGERNARSKKSRVKREMREMFLEGHAQ